MTVRTRASLKDIAAEIGVSVATVSNAMSGKGRVSEELGERIRATALARGYVPSLSGRALRTGRSGVLGLVLADIANPLFPQIAQAVEAAASASGYGVLIADSRGDVTEQTQAIRRLMERGADGLIVVPRRGTRVGEIGLPVAVIDTPSTPGNTVSADHWGGGQQVIGHLAGLGHRQFVLIGGSAASNVQNDRIAGMRSALPAGARHAVIWAEPAGAPPQRSAPLGLAARAAEGATAFAAVSDLLALRALTELQSAGLGVPEDVSVTGFDDLVWAGVVTPGLTTLQMDMATIARHAVAELLRLIERPESASDLPRSGVPMRLIVRQSAGVVRPARTRPTEGANPT
ncbi:LacI family transcriptional regulator (plasmid) [Paroceanicella profunda]|uniref:LacI family transcriptional regulator n=1 Tax=Paroceanicella profunda TaxID=2579971 RepID=A0A5B8G2B5_9RHOB|nr:LacI family DNA-binding transcriptional regulator [Paroceanicella profunda]QDL94040.1 LacI family transcriptional regulator [Paroceanicella profunda]